MAKELHRFVLAGVLSALSKTTGHGNINPIKQKPIVEPSSGGRDFTAAFCKYKHILCHQQSGKSAFLRPAAQLLKQLDDGNCKLDVCKYIT